MPSFRTFADYGICDDIGIQLFYQKWECRFGHAINHKRSLYSAFLAERAGIPAVPHIYAVNDFDIEKWIQYLIRNPQIRLFSMNCQLQRSRADVDMVIASVRAILQRVPWEMHVILTGFPFRDVYHFGPMLDRIHFVDKMASKYAQNHRKIDLDFETGRMLTRGSNESIPFLTKHNLNQRRIFIELAKERALQGYIIPKEILAMIKRPVLQRVRRRRS